MSVLDAIAKQYENNKSGGGNSGGSYEQDFSKYFAVRLEDGVDNGELTVRLMPPKKGVHPVNKEGETPFDEGHWHSVKVGGKWRKIYCRKQRIVKDVLYNLQAWLFLNIFRVTKLKVINIV